MIENLKPEHRHHIYEFDSLYARDNIWLKLCAYSAQLINAERTYVVTQFEHVIAYYRLKLATMADYPIVMAHFAVDKTQDRKELLEEMIEHAMRNFKKAQEMVPLKALVAHIKYADLDLFKKHDFVVLTKSETHVEVMWKE